MGEQNGRKRQVKMEEHKETEQFRWSDLGVHRVGVHFADLKEHCFLEFEMQARFVFHLLFYGSKTVHPNNFPTSSATNKVNY